MAELAPLMDFSFTPEQEDLRELVRGFLAKHTVRSRDPGSYDAVLWRRLTSELGVTDPGLGGVELGIVLEETGRALLALPYLSTVVAARFVPLADGATATVYCGSGLAARDGVIDGIAPGVMEGDIADTAVVVASDEVYAVPLTGVDREPTSTLDHSRPTATLTFRGAPATRLRATPDEVLDALHLSLAAESIGVAAASLDQTVSYLKTRHQFGQPLASFQALRHRVADLAVVLESAISTAWYAIRSGEDERPVLAPMAKLVAADAAYAVTADAIQLHGGIGFTWEHDAHRYFKRAAVTRLTHGDPVMLRRVLAARAAMLASPSPHLRP
jgi:alkylation response protein AidB-like acyl-CoA dehydrogenase